MNERQQCPSSSGGLSRTSTVWKLTRPIRGVVEALRQKRSAQNKSILWKLTRPVRSAAEAVAMIQPRVGPAKVAQQPPDVAVTNITFGDGRTLELFVCANVKVLGYHIARQLASKLPTVPTAGMPARVGLASKACTQDDIESSWFAYWCKRLKVAPVYHRKLWEFCYILQALFDAGALRSAASGIGFGCGEEPLPSLFASMGISVTATDAPGEIARAWATSGGQYAHSLNNLFRADLCHRSEFDSLVSLKYVDMNNIPHTFAGKFDFAWSSCALEHLGSIAHGLRFLEETLKCLKPGGVAVHTTELNFTSDEDTIDNGGTVLFLRKHFTEIAQRLTEKGCRVEALDFNTGSGFLDQFIDVPPYEGAEDAHLRLIFAGFGTTSFGLIVRNAG